MKKPNLSFLSLFSGCGGFDLGFCQAGFRCAGAFDIDTAAVKTHNANFSSGALILDLAKNDNKTLRHFDVDVDVVISGPPCQGFSTAGKRRLDDPRNYLLLAAARIALGIRPKVIVFENVRGVLSGLHRQYWLKLTSILNKNGYRTTDFLVNTEQIGLAQMRKRMILVAWNTKNEWAPVQIPEPRCVLSDVLESINGAPNHNICPLEPGSEMHTIAKQIKPGQKLSNVRGGPRSVHTWDIPEIYGETFEEERHVLSALLRLRRRLRLRETGDADPVLASELTKETGYSVRGILSSLQQKKYVKKMQNRYDLLHTFNGKFRRLRWDQPSYTVDTRFTDSRYFLHPNEHRGFTVREAARIQGFPDSFLFMGTEKQQSRLVGNAVPPPLARWIALSVKKMLKN